MNKIKKLLLGALCAAMVIFCISAVPAKAGTAGDAAREKAWNSMWAQATVFWSPSVKIEYEHNSYQLGGNEYWPGSAYLGLPYTQSQSSLKRSVSAFKGLLDDGRYGTFKSWVPTTAQLTYEKYNPDGTDTGRKAKLDLIDIVMGNDCSSAIYWALASVADVTFSGTNTMYPANGMGLKFVETENVKPSQIAAIAGEKSYSCDIMQGGALGQKTSDYKGSVDELLNEAQMFELYGALKRGDVLVSNFLAETLEGQSKGEYHHSIMVDEVDLINKRVKILQHGGMGNKQGTDCNLELVPEGISYSESKFKWTKDSVPYEADGRILWNYGWTSFDYLNKYYYIPLTLEEYDEGAATGSVTVDNDLIGSLYLTYGTVRSENIRLESVNITIKSADGKETLGSTTLFTDTYRYGLFKGQNSQRLTENSMDLGQFAWYLLKYGMQRGEEYTYTLTASLADGTEQVLKNYKFTY